MGTNRGKKISSSADVSGTFPCFINFRCSRLSYQSGPMPKECLKCVFLETYRSALRICINLDSHAGNTLMVMGFLMQK